MDGRVLRLLRDALGVQGTGQMDTAQAAIRRLKQWKRGKVRFRKLRQHGVGANLAAQTAGAVTAMEDSRQSRDALCAPDLILRLAWSPKLFLVHSSIHPNAGCGPACPVVWQGERATAPLCRLRGDLLAVARTAEESTSSATGARPALVILSSSAAAYESR